MKTLLFFLLSAVAVAQPVMVPAQSLFSSSYGTGITANTTVTSDPIRMGANGKLTLHWEFTSSSTFQPLVTIKQWNTGGTPQEWLATSVAMSTTNKKNFTLSKPQDGTDVGLVASDYAQVLLCNPTGTITPTSFTAAVR